MQPQLGIWSHDSIWAFTLALNQSLQNFTPQDLELNHLGLHVGKRNLTSVIESNLKMVNFSGATGQVQFNENHESDTEVWLGPYAKIFYAISPTLGQL